MDSLYRTTFTVPPHEIDFSNRLKISALFNAIQTTAADHAEGLDLGYKALHPAGLFWVLSWVRLEIERLTRDQVSITAETWPHRRYRIFSLRDFLFLDEQEQVYARARSAWLLINANSRRVTSLDNLPHPVHYLEERSALESMPDKIHTMSDGELLLEKEIRYSDLDLNQHTNNARYVEFMLDGYSEEFHRRHRMQSLTFFFRSESRCGDRLLLHRYIEPERPSRHHLRAVTAGEDEKTVFQAVIDWLDDII